MLNKAAPKVIKEFKCTSSIRYAQMRNGHIWMPSIDKHVFAGTGTAWERLKDLVPNDPNPFYFMCEASAPGAGYITLIPVKLPPGMKKPAHVHIAQVQDKSTRIRFHTDLHKFLPMEGDQNTKAQLLDNEHLRIYYPPELSTGVPHLDDMIHGRVKMKKESV